MDLVGRWSKPNSIPGGRAQVSAPETLASIDSGGGLGEAVRPTQVGGYALTAARNPTDRADFHMPLQSAG